MTTYQKLIEVVSSDSFWENDDFFRADQLLYNFTSQEWEQLKAEWLSLDKEVRNNIITSFNINEPYYMRLLDFAQYLVQIKDLSSAQRAFYEVRAKTYSQEEEELYLQVAYQLFRHIKELRRLKSLKQKVWETGHSNKFLKRFQFVNWEEVFQLSSNS